MVVTLFSCYFLPFLLFFIAQMLVPKSLGVCLVGVTSASLGTLFLFYSIKYREYLLQKQVKVAPQPVKRILSSPLTSFVPKPLPLKPAHKSVPDHKEIISKLEREKAEMIAFFEQQGRELASELEQKERKLKELERTLETTQKTLIEREGVVQTQKTELENLKFEMYTIMRIDSYMSHKSESAIAC